MADCTKCGTTLTEGRLGTMCPRCFLLEGLTPSDAEPTAAGEPFAGAEATASSAAAPGARLRYFGDYELLEEIAHGGMGVIYKARQISLNRTVAVKMILSGLLAGEKEVKRFHAEAEAAANLDHPNIVPIYEVGQHEGQHYFSMRYVEGHDLAQWMSRSSRREEALSSNPKSEIRNPKSTEPPHVGCYPSRETVALMIKLARAVHYAHQRGILHRDLKPANVLVDSHGEPHIADFGLARRTTGDGDLTLSGAMMGTPHYASPEQAAGKTHQLTTATDIYSLGAILYFLLTRRPPFEADSALRLLRMVEEQPAERPGKINSGVDRDLDTICLKCLEKDPQRRYASADALADDLERWLRHEPILARRSSTREHVVKWVRRKPALARMAGVALVAVLTVSGIAAWRLTVAHRQRELEQYAANISLADTAIRGGSMDRALDYLMKCPEPLRHWEWGRLLFECLEEVSSIPAHTNRPRFLMQSLLEGIAFNSHGTRLSSRGSDGTMAIWDPIEGREFLRVGDVTNQVTASSFRPGHNEIAVGRSDGSLEILDSESGRLLSRLIPPHIGWTNRSADPVAGLNLDVYDAGPIRDPLRRRPWAVAGIDWNRAGGRIVIVRADGAVRVRELDGTGKERTWFPAGPTSSVKAWFTPDDSAIVIQSSGVAQQFDPSTGRELEGLRWDPPAGGPSGAWVSPPGDRMVLIDSEGRATLRNASAVLADLGPLIRRNANAPLAVFFSRDGSHFCTTGDVGTARVFRTDTGAALFALPDTVYGGAFSAEADQLAVFGLDRILHVWDVHHRIEVRPLRGHLSTLTSVTYAPRGQLLATGSREGVVKIWSARHHGRVLFGDTLVTSSIYSPDGRWLATSPCFRGIRLWEAETGRLRWKVPSRTQSTYTPVFSADSRLLYSGGSDRCVRIYHVQDGRPAGMLRGHQRPVWALHCSPDGQYVATGDHGGVVKIWDPQTRRELQSFVAHPAAVWSVFFDPHSRFLVTAGSGKPRVWEVITGRPVVELDEGGVGAYQAVFSPDGQHVVAACLDNQIRTWEIPSGKVVSIWPSQTQGASYVSYSPDGFRFSVPVSDMSALGFSLPKLEIWDAEHGRALLNLEAHRESIFTALFDASGRRLVTASMDTTVRQWEAFPWRDADYTEPRGTSLEERVRHFARQYWRERVAKTADASAAVKMSEEAPLPPGIPEWERERWPERDPAARPLQINLDRYYTGVLDALFYPSWTDAEYDDDLSSLPTGLQRLGGVWFDVRGVIWLRSELADPAEATYRATCHDFPERVEGIAIGRAFQKLHVLHAASTYDPRIASRHQAGSASDRRAIGAYVLHYADGTRHEHEIQYGRDLRNWWWGGRGDDVAEAERAMVAWVGTNGPSSRYEAKVRLFLSTFENPRPDVEVISVDFISKQTPFAPFLVAMSVEP